MRRPPAAHHQYLTSAQPMAAPHSPQLSPMHLQLPHHLGHKSPGLLTTAYGSGASAGTVVSLKCPPLPNGDSSNNQPSSDSDEPNGHSSRSDSPPVADVAASINHHHLAPSSPASADSPTNEDEAEIPPASTHHRLMVVNGTSSNGGSPIAMETSSSIVGRSAVAVVPNQYVEMFIV